MIKLIIKKEIMENWINITDIYSLNHKWIRYYLIKFYYKHKKFKCDGEKRNYTIEEIEYE